MKLEDIKRSRAACSVMAAVFTVFLAFFTLGTFLQQPKDFSEMENRTLAKKPELSKEKLFSGELDEDVEEYMSDHVFLKDAMMCFRTTCDYFSGKTLQNGVYFSKDGYLLQRFTEDEANFSKNVSYLNDFAEKINVPTDLILAPNSVCVNKDKLPAFACTDDQRKAAEELRAQLSSKINLFDAYETLTALQAQGIQAYYRTDHHWTASGARAVCDNWLISQGLSPTSADFRLHSVGDFYGTLYSKAPAAFVKPDGFAFFENKNIGCKVEYLNEGKTADSCMDESFFDKKDKYASYFGGNFAKIKITSSCKSGKSILVLKDSYANSLIPLLTEQFSEIYVIDLRYLHFEKVSDIIEQNGIERVLMVYNVDFINEDKNFIWLE